MSIQIRRCLLAFAATLILAACEPAPPAAPLMDIYKAIELGNVEQARANIFHKTFDPSVGKGTRYRSPLALTLAQGARQRSRTGGTSEVHNEILALLLDAGANPNNKHDDDAPLNLAIELHNKEAMQLLLDAGADIKGQIGRAHV